MICIKSGSFSFRGGRDLDSDNNFVKQEIVMLELCLYGRRVSYFDSSNSTYCLAFDCRE